MMTTGGERSSLWLVVGFVAVCAAYIGGARLPLPDGPKLWLWVAVAGGGGWLYHHNGGAWLDSTRGTLRWLVRGLAILLGALVVLGALAWAVSPGSSSSDGDSASLHLISPANAVIRFGLMPIVEEVAFRGFLYDVFAKRGIPLAIGGTATVFSLAHLVGHRDPAYVVAVAPVALVLGVMRQNSGGIALPIAFHMMFKAMFI